MSPFLLFAIVLTIAYIIYYGVLISKELYGKKSLKDSTEEIFDLGNISDEDAIQVHETENGFDVGESASYANEATSESQPMPATSQDEKGKTLQPDTKGNEHAILNKAEKLKAELNEAEVESECGMNAPELHELLMGRRESLFKPEMKITRDAI